MEGKDSQKPPKNSEKYRTRKIDLPPVSITEIQDRSHLMLSPRGTDGDSSKASPHKMSCLCSPTTHAGSFRCRFHRNPGIPRRGSIGSNLNQLAAKSGGISSSLQAQ
ncbi:hypothetical protein MLD38_000889 [Melastoma candidum]|uniref:Uncharacterized protein n=1 Tax=Melastoma candidum TaxID=119954 RepID=A0ACB9SBJ5_9MYRT|nr:hypothetical protein MLD38_000889 [Melastoma candidum]